MPVYMPASRKKKEAPGLGFDLWLPVADLPTGQAGSELSFPIWLFQKHLYICNLCRKSMDKPN